MPDSTSRSKDGASRAEGGRASPTEGRRRTVRARLAAALLLPLGAASALLVTSTHHRPLGAVTIATLLVAIVFVSEIAIFRRVE